MKGKLVKIFGLSGSLMAIGMYFAMVEIMISNFKDLTAIWILPVLTVVNCASWLGYGYLRKDFFIIMANTVGIIVSIATVFTAFS